jgi:hypothetical protein
LRYPLAIVANPFGVRGLGRLRKRWVFHLVEEDRVTVCLAFYPFWGLSMVERWGERDVERTKTFPPRHLYPGAFPGWGGKALSSTAAL